MNKYGKICRCLSVFLLLSMLLSLLPTGVFAQEAVYEPSSTEQVLATKAAGTDYTATLNALERPAAAYSEHEDMSNIPTGSKETVGTGDYVMLVTVNTASYAFAPKNLSTAYSETVDSVRVTIDADGNYLHFDSEEDARSATLNLKANTNNDYKHERLFVRRDGLIVQPIGHNGSPYFRAVTSSTETFGFTYVTGEDGLVAYKGIVLNSGENRTRHNLVFGDGSFFFGNPTTYPREENTTVYFYKMTPITETLYNALQSAKSYAKGNPNGTYDPELYDGFITCLEDAIDLYNASNHYLSKEELARKDELAQALDTRAANLQSFMTLLDQSSYTARAGKLTEALGWQNVHISTIGRTDVLGLDGTYFLVNKASNGKYYVLDPSDSADAKNVGSKEVTLSADGEHVVGTGIEYAVDIIRDPLLEEKHTYYIRLHNGDYLRGEYLNGTACLTMGFSHTPFGLTLRALDSNSAATADGLFFHRNITLNADQTKPNPYPENPKHYLLYHPTEQDFGLTNWYNTVSHTMYLYRLTWSTEELYDAIVKMATLADSKKGKMPQGLYDGFTAALDESISLYLRYNASYTRGQLEQCMEIRDKLKAQVERLLSWESILASAYDQAIQNLQTPFSERDRTPLQRTKVAPSVDKYYYIVNPDPDSPDTTVRVVDPSGRFSYTEYFEAVELSLSGDRLLGALPDYAFHFEASEDSNGKVLPAEFRPWPVYNTGFSVEKDTDFGDQASYPIAAMRINVQMGNATFSNPGGNTLFVNRNYDDDGDNNNDQYHLTYDPATKTFCYKKQNGYMANDNNVFRFYRVNGAVLDLYKAITRMEVYAGGNTDDRYPSETYNAFLSCLNDSILQYQYYNTHVMSHWDEEKLKETLDAQAEALLAYIDSLTLSDTIADFIDIPVEILDFRADGFMLEYSNNTHGLSYAATVAEHYGFEEKYLLACTRAWPTFIKADGTVINTVVSRNLTEKNLINGNLVYTEKALRQIAYTIIAGLAQQKGNIPNQNNQIKIKADELVKAAAAYEVESPEWMKILGSAQDTFNKTTTPGKNGGELKWGDITTAYDLAYYTMNYMWRPVSSKMDDGYAYNVTVPERAVFRLFNDGKGMYTLNAENWTEYTGYYTYNAYPTVPAEIRQDSPNFMPIDELGFEKELKETEDTDLSKYLYNTSRYDTEHSNFHYTVHAKGSFVFSEEQNLYFEFLGDDDVYFYINGIRAMDLGGAHSAAGDTLYLNDKINELGLVDGEIYSFDMFYAERHTTASNLHFSTNIRLMDRDLLTKKSQYDSSGTALLDGAAVNEGSCVTYSFELENRRALPVRHVSFSDPSLGIYMSKDLVTFHGTAVDTLPVKLNLSYRSIDTEENTVYSGKTTAYSNYIDFKTMIEDLTNATDNPRPFLGGCSFVVTTVAQLRELLSIGIPASCQLSVHGMVRTATAGKYTNTVTSAASPVTLDANGGQIILSPVNGSASRSIYGINLENVRIPEPLQIVLDYGKPIELPMNELWTRVGIKDKNMTLDYMGLSFSGENGAIRIKEPLNLFCNSTQAEAEDSSCSFYLNEGVPTFRLKEMMTAPKIVYAIYRLHLRDSEDAFAYLWQEIQLIPATVMYYETDFAENIFRFTAGASSTKGTSQAENQDDGTVFPGDAFLKTGNEEKDYSHALFFDFSNNSVDQRRYQQPQYNGKNYDDLSAWSLYHSQNLITEKSMNADAGTLSFHPVNNFNSANRLDLRTASDLAFDPAHVEVMQFRLKMEGFSSYNNDGGFFRLWWFGKKDGVDVKGYENAYYTGKDYVSDGKFVTYTLDLTSIANAEYSEGKVFDLRDLDSMDEFYFSIHNFALTTESKVTIDYLYIGPKNNAPRQHGQNSLYFTFDNTDSDKHRYEYPQYAGLSPDTEGWISRQHVPNDKVYPITPVIDNASGTISATYVKAMTTANNVQFEIDGLDYPVAQAEILRVRVKLENMIPIEGKARLRLWYRSEGMAAGTSEWTGPMGNIPDTKGGAYINVTINLDDDFRGRKNLNMLQLAFHEFEVTLDSKITIDSIYMGPAADAPGELEMNYSSPKNDFLYFGFENDTQAQNRYRTSTYSGINFDLPEDGDAICWDVNEGRCRMPEIDSDSGTMTLVAEYDTSDNENYDKGFYVHNGELNAAKQWLNYSPEHAEVAQVRVRFKGFKPTESAKPCIYLRGHMDGVYKEKQGDKMVDICNIITEKVHIDPRFLDSDRYITLSMPINEAVRTNAAILNSIRLNFENMTSISTASYGSVSIDYIYVGPKDSAPEPVYGYDSSYEDDTADSNASSLYAEGLGFKKENSSDPYTRAEFSFTGTGFDLISRTGPKQATIRVKVYTDPSLPETSCIKTITMNNKGELDLYQIPVVSLQGLAYGTYYVAIDVNYAIDIGYELLKRGNQFYFDAVRIYDPMNVEEEELSNDGFYALTAYLSDKEAHNFTKEIRNILLSAEEFAELFASQEGAVFVDAQTGPEPSEPASEPKLDDIIINDHIAMNVQTYNKTGPKNEVYLAPGQAVAFRLEVPADFYPESVDVGAKTIHGKEVNIVAGLITSSNTGNVLTVANRTSVNLSSCNARYYALDLDPNILTTETVNGTKYRSCYVVLYNNTDKSKATTGGDYVLSITDIKLAYGIASSIGMEDLPSDPEIHKKSAVESSPTVRFTVDARAAEAAATLIRAQVETPVIMEGAQLMHSLNLASDISLNYVLSKTTVADYDSFYVQCRIPVYEGSELTGYSELALQPTERGEYYYFTLDGLTAVQMNDTIEAVLYCRKDGRLYSSCADQYSIAQYAYAQLAKGNASAPLKTLCADLLRYGSCAQSYKLYRTASLADAALWAQARGYQSDMSSIFFGSTNVTGNEIQAPSITWAGKALSLDSKVSMKYVINTGAYEGELSDLSLRISYTDLSGQEQTAVVRELEVYSKENSLYAFTFDGLLAAELRTVLTARVYAKDSPVSVSLCYSPDTYGNGKTGTLGALCKALFAYSDSAKAFFQ